MERSESKDEKDQLCLSIIGQRKYFIKEYLNKVFDSIPVYISRDVGAMEILEIFLKESLINKHDLNLFAQEESYFFFCSLLENIQISDSVKIGKHVFQGCPIAKKMIR